MKAAVRIIVVIFLCHTSYSQNIDSIHLKLEQANTTKRRGDLNYELTKAYVNNNQDSIIKYGVKTLEIYNRTGAKNEVLVDLYYELGIAYMDVDLKKSKKFLNRSLKKSTKIQNDSLINLSYLAYSAYFTHTYEIDSSTYYLLKATDYFLEQNDSISLAYCYFNIMSNYSDVSNYIKSREYGEKTLEIAQSNKIEHIIGPITIALAHVYFKVNEIDKGNNLLSDAETIALSKNDNDLLLQVYLAKGVQQIEIGEYNESIETYKKAIVLIGVQGNDYYASTCYFQLGYAYFKIHDNEKAAENIEKSLEYKVNPTDKLKKAYIYLAMIYASTNSVKQDFYLDKYDSISSSEVKLKTEELLLEFETLEKEKEIEILKSKKAEDALIIEKGKVSFTLIASLLALTILVLIFFIYRYYSRKKILNQQIELEKHKTEQAKNNLKQKERELILKIEAIKDNTLVIENLKTTIKETYKDEEYIKSIVNSLEQNYVSDKHWDTIIHYFETLYSGEISDLKHKSENITRNDIKLYILTKLNYSNSGMAEVLNVSIEGVKKAKHRLKKKTEGSVN